MLDPLQYEKFGTTELWFYYDVDGAPLGVRYKNGNITSDYYFVCNWRGALVADYNYDTWGNVISAPNINNTEITPLSTVSPPLWDVS